MKKTSKNTVPQKRDIQDCTVIEKLFDKGRWWAVLDKSFRRRKKIAYANYTWLMGNPAFKEIPTGYVVHHLDWDRTNDDISNLVSMQKHHHVSHHWKNKIITPKIKLNLKPKRFHPWEYAPVTEPTIHKVYKGKSYYLYFREDDGMESKAIKVYRYNGINIPDIETAEKFKSEIWKPIATCIDR